MKLLKQNFKVKRKLNFKNKNIENDIYSFLENLRNYENNTHFTLKQQFKDIDREGLDNFLRETFEDWRFLVIMKEAERFTAPFLGGLWANVTSFYSIERDELEFELWDPSIVSDIETYRQSWWFFNIGLRLGKVDNLIEFEETSKAYQESYSLKEEINVDPEDIKIKEKMDQFLVSMTDKKMYPSLNDKEKFQSRDQLNDFLCKNSEHWVFLRTSRKADSFIKYFLSGLWDSRTGNGDSFSDHLIKANFEELENKDQSKKFLTAAYYKWVFSVGFLIKEGPAYIEVYPDESTIIYTRNEISISEIKKTHIHFACPRENGPFPEAHLATCLQVISIIPDAF